jgi:hypothetical protein
MVKLRLRDEPFHEKAVTDLVSFVYHVWNPVPVGLLRNYQK